MEKKGQLTIFIIVGVILIASMALFFILRNSLGQDVTIPETANVENFVRGCIEEVGTDVIEKIGNGGGYYFSSDIATDSGLAVHYSKGQNYIPTQENIQEEINSYVEENLFFCTRNFVDFPELDITQGGIKVDSKINDEEVILDVDYLISVGKENNTNILRDFKISIPVRLGVIYNSILEIVQTSREDICLSCILDVSLKNDFYVDMNDVDGEKVMFVVKDENSKLNDEPFEWVFVIDYA